MFWFTEVAQTRFDEFRKLKGVLVRCFSLISMTTLITVASIKMHFLLGTKTQWKFIWIQFIYTNTIVFDTPLVWTIFLMKVKWPACGVAARGLGAHLHHLKPGACGRLDSLPRDTGSVTSGLYNTAYLPQISPGILPIYRPFRKGRLDTNSTVDCDPVVQDSNPGLQTRSQPW